MSNARKLTPFDRLGIKEGGLVAAARQMGELHIALKQQELIELQRKKAREHRERQVQAKS